MEYVEQLTAFMERLPFLFYSATALYAVCLLCLLAPRVRAAVSSAIEIPEPSTRQHLLPLDTFRGFSALWVATFHACVLSGSYFLPVISDVPYLSIGPTGVKSFAVLSGFLIYRTLRKVDSIERFRQYLMRRLIRIYPLYLVALAGCALIFKPKLHQLVAEIFMFKLLGYPTCFTLVAWSLYVEVLFYMVLPLLVFSFRERTWQAALALIVLLFLGERGGTQELELWKFFLMGVLASECVDRFSTKITSVIGTGILLAAFGSFHFAYISIGTKGLLGSIERDTLMAVSMCMLVVAACTTPYITRFFSFKVFRWAGVVSYSTYLLHMLILYVDMPYTIVQAGGIANVQPLVPHQDISFPAAFLFLFVIPAFLFWSTVSYVLIERPFLNMRRRFSNS